MSEFFVKFSGDLKPEDVTDYQIKGILTSYGNKDQSGDIMMHGALDEWLGKADRLPMLYNHDRSKIIGEWTNFALKNDKLHADGVLYDYVELAGEVQGHIKRGIVSGVSIGFRAKDFSFRDDGDDFGINFHSIDIKEASVVLFPNNLEATITEKSLTRRRALRKEMTDEQTKDLPEPSRETDKIVRELSSAIQKKADTSDVKAIEATLTKQIEKEITVRIEKQEAEIVELRKELDAEIVKARENFNKDFYQPTEWKPDPTREGTLTKNVDYGTRRTIEELRWQKSVSTNDLTPGYRVETIAPFFDLQAGNPLYPYQTNRQVNSGSFKVPETGTVTFSEEASLPSSRTVQGSVASKDVNIKTVTCMVGMAEPAGDDVTGLRMSLESVIYQAAANKHGIDAATLVIDGVHPASGTPPITNVTTGVAATLPTDANLVAKLSEMVKTIGTEYRPQCVWLISKAVEARINAHEKSSGAGFSKDIANGFMRLLGYPVVVSDHMQDGDTANDVSIVFGNFGRGLLCGDRETLMLSEHPDTFPGRVTWFGRMRYAYTLWDTLGLVGMITKQ